MHAGHLPVGQPSDYLDRSVKEFTGSKTKGVEKQPGVRQTNEKRYVAPSPKPVSGLFRARVCTRHRRRLTSSATAASVSPPVIYRRAGNAILPNCREPPKSPPSTKFRAKARRNGPEKRNWGMVTTSRDDEGIVSSARAKRESQRSDERCLPPKRTIRSQALQPPCTLSR